MVHQYTTKFRIEKPTPGTMDWFSSYFDFADIIDAHVPRVYMSAPRVLTLTPKGTGANNLTIGQIYYYKVIAENAGTQKTMASWEDIGALIAAPNRTIQVDWSLVIGATNYHIYRYNTVDPSYIPQDGDFLFLATVGAVTTYDDDGSVVPGGAMPVAPVVPTWDVTEIKQLNVLGESTQDDSTWYPTPANITKNLDNVRYIMKWFGGEANWNDAPYTNFAQLRDGRAGGHAFVGGTLDAQHLSLKANAPNTNGFIQMLSDVNMLGKTIYGSNSSTGDLILNSTSHPTKGFVKINSKTIITTGSNEEWLKLTDGTDYLKIVHDGDSIPRIISSRQLRIEGINGGTFHAFGWGAFTFQTDVAPNTAEFKNCKVGIGVTPALELLHINSVGTNDARIRLNAPTAYDTEIQFYNNNIIDFTVGHDDATDHFVIGTANVDTPLVSFTKNYEIGIGTNDPGGYNIKVVDPNADSSIVAANFAVDSVSRFVLMSQLGIVTGAFQSTSAGLIELFSGVSKPFYIGANGSATAIQIDLAQNIGFSTAVGALDALSAFFPGVNPKMEILTGTSTNAYTECIVLRHANHDGDAELRRIGIVFKGSSESGIETIKQGAILLESESANFENVSMRLVVGSASQMRLAANEVVMETALRLPVNPPSSPQVGDIWVN